MIRIPRILFAATLVAGLAACGGGGGGGISSLPTAGGSQQTTPTQPAQTQSASAQMTILIPARTAAANHRNSAYISASTQSMTIGQTAGTQTTQLAEVDLTPSSPNCSPVTGGGTQCNVSFVGTAGTATYVLSTYNQTGGKGSVLSTGKIQATLTAGQNTTIPLALDGVPASVSVVLGVSTLPVGTTASTGIFVQALDASGNIIVGPGGFASPIGLAIGGDTHSTLALSSASVASPGQVVTLNYNGGSNVGSTITPSISGVAGTPATFAGSGASLTVFSGYNAPMYAYPDDVTALAGAKAAVLSYRCCSPSIGTISIISPTAILQQFVGDTTDPFNPPSSEPTYTGYTVVHGMSQSLNTEVFDAYDDIGASADGSKIYYSGSFSTSSDTTNCPGNAEQSGTLGILVPATGTATEIVLKGYASAFRTDTAGNLWFIEYSGQCNGTNLLGSDQYAIGELKANATTVTETPFSTAGLSTIGYPSDMSITADGTKLYIADSNGSTITPVTTGTLTAGTAVALTNSTQPYAIATAPDGSTMWWSDNDPGNDYFYGFIPGSKAFSAANLQEPVFPINYFYSNDLAYADGSFWAAGTEYGTGIGRVSGVAAGAPVAGYYPMPNPDSDGQEIPSIAAGNGYIWAVDYDYGNIDVMQYGAPGNGTLTLSTHRLGVANTVRNRTALGSSRHGAQSQARHS